ncbi:hypothetical protein OG462_09095 [Streptomyces sp. NBC_01077]|uniref:hypothetical protein n=1 Tax=Streptomyces sp. NBC_01077 TaxID=2903746 RepID=UPI00386BE083|nr:hypothetical protein OG462_09095 [Streptomyces sp. NBC_01077]
MVRIRILQSVAGLDFSWAPGDEVEVDDEAAGLWVDGVRAEVVEGAEKAAARSRGGGRGQRAETRSE